MAWSNDAESATPLKTFSQSGDGFNNFQCATQNGYIHKYRLSFNKKDTSIILAHMCVRHIYMYLLLYGTIDDIDYNCT